MDAETPSTSSRSTAGHRLYRTHNLESAEIYFKRPRPAPAKVLDLRARLFGTEGNTLRSHYGLNPVSLAVVDVALLPSSGKATYEACLARARLIQSALDTHDFDAVEEDWMDVNNMVLQILINEQAFHKT